MARPGCIQLALLPDPTAQRDGSCDQGSLSSTSKHFPQSIRVKKQKTTPISQMMLINQSHLRKAAHTQKNEHFLRSLKLVSMEIEKVPQPLYLYFRCRLCAQGPLTLSAPGEGWRLSHFTLSGQTKPGPVFCGMPRRAVWALRAMHGLRSPQPRNHKPRPDRKEAAWPPML